MRKKERDEEEETKMKRHIQVDKISRRHNSKKIKKVYSLRTAVVAKTRRQLRLARSRQKYADQERNGRFARGMCRCAIKKRK